MKQVILTLKIILVLTGLMFTINHSGIVSAQTTDVAMLSQPEGDVELRRHRRKRVLRDDVLLNQDDVIRVFGNGTAVIFQPYVTVTRLGSNNRQFVVVKHTPPSPKNALTPAEFARLKSNYLAAQQNRKNLSPVVMGGTEDAVLISLEPRNSVVLGSRPTFIWNQIANATKYLVNIYNTNGSVICTETTNNTKLTLPDNCPPLEPGEYKWDVTARLGNQALKNSALYDASPFSVATEKEVLNISGEINHAQALSATNDDASLIYITTLMEYGLYPLAEKELHGALERAPTNDLLWSLLMETYSRMKRWNARERARLLSSTNPTGKMIRSLEKWK